MTLAFRNASNLASSRPSRPRNISSLCSPRVGNSFSSPSATRDIIDVTSSDSADFAREFIAGLIDYGEAGAEIIWDLGTTSDTLLRSLLTERTPRTWEASFAQYTPARTITFEAFLTGYEPDAPMEDKMTASITLKVTGAPVVA